MPQQLKMNFTNSEVRNPLNVNLMGSRSLPNLKTTNIVNYQHNYLTSFNRLDFRHWGIPLFSNKNEANGEIIYNAIYLSSNQKKFRDLSLYKLVEKYQELNISEKNKINSFLANER